MKKNNLSLFQGLDNDESWKKEWNGMPEFIQEKQKPYSTIIVRCETKEDLEALSKLIGQKLTKKTKSIWFPFKSHFRSIQKHWGDES